MARGLNNHDRRRPHREQHGGSILAGATLILVTIGAHLPALRGGFVWDDPVLVSENPMLRTGRSLYEFWFTTKAPDYFPLTNTVFWIQWQLWGSRPLGYHAVNIALHALSTVLLWRVLRRLHLPPAAPFLGALLFGVHPVTVMSVAWISELKNVLPMALYLASILAWLHYQEQRRRGWYAMALAFAAAALLAKTSTVMLPFVLLLLVWWLHGRVTRRNLYEVIPFFALSAALGLVTWWFQTHNVIGQEVVRPEGWASRIAATGWIFWFYVYKALLPIRLSVIYPRWQVDGSRLSSFIPLVLAIGLYAALWAFRRRGTRGLLVAMSCYGLTLLPVLGLVNMYFMKFSLVSDHLQYTALPALLAGCAALLARWIGPAPHPAAGQSSVFAMRTAPVAALVLVLCVLTWRQAGTFKDPVALWTHVIELNDRAPAAWGNRGAEYHARGDYDRAVADASRALELEPDSASSYTNRGHAWYGKGEYERALADYDQAVRLNPRYAEAFEGRGNALTAMGRIDAALSAYDQAVQLRPGDAEVYNARGAAWLRKKEFALAIADFDRAIALRPEYADAYANRAAAWVHQRQYDRALKDLDTATRLQPDSARHRAAAARLRVQLGRLEEGLTHADAAVRLGPGLAEAYAARADVLAHRGELDRAIADYSQVIALKADDAEALNNRGVCYARGGRLREALIDFQTAIALKPGYAEAHGNLCNAYLDRGEQTRAIIACTRAIELKTDHAEAYCNRGLAYLRLQNFDQARADLKSCQDLGGAPPADLVKDLATEPGSSQ